LSIGVSQLKNLLGLSVPDKDYTYQTLAYILSHLQHGRLPSLVRHPLGSESRVHAFHVAAWAWAV
jgi:hypothetical protein